MADTKDKVIEDTFKKFLKTPNIAIILLN